MRGGVLLLVVLVATGASSSARADDAAVCSEAFDLAQTRRDEGKLLEARRLLRTCSRPGCSSTQQTLCSQWLADLEARIPSLVPSARDSSGAELIDVRVTMDGTEVARSINGRAIDVDPGLHSFVFERADGTRVTTRALAGERGKGKLVEVTFGRTPATPAAVVAPPVLAPPPPEQFPPPRPASDAPPAYTGGQLAVRTGVQFPFGSASGLPNDSMGNTFSWQVPFVLEAGWKFTPNWFVGLYGGLAFGGTAGAVSNTCSQNQASCLGAGAWFGLEVLYYFSPAQSMDPWLGYGIGYEQSSVALSNSSGNGGTVSDEGWQFGHFMAGLDFRLGRFIGIGPLIDLSLGQYSTQKETIDTMENGTDTQVGSGSAGITQKALHEWLLIGGRLVVFP